MRRTGLLIGAALFASPTVAGAQAFQCSIPSTVDPVHAELPSAAEPRRLLPIGGYTLAVTWAPEFCHSHDQTAAGSFECGAGNRFGFTLHGLWPDGQGAQWPQYCRATALLPSSVLRPNMCATPSAQLLQHEWSKHGTCMPHETPASYFRRSTGLYRKLRWPDMARMAAGSPTAGDVARALAARNPALPADAVRVTVNRQGWLDELWLCLDTRFRYRRCRAGSGGVPADTPVKIAPR